MSCIPKRFKIISYFLAFILYTSNCPIFGQLRYESLSTAQGLSQGYIWDILQCKDGFLWVSTKAGLNRYDGYSFKVFNNDANNPNSISHNMVWYIYEDTKGRIWVGTDFGLNIFDKKTEKFYKLFHDPKNKNSLSGNIADEEITELADGRFLVNTSNEYFDLVSVPVDFFNNEKAIKISHIKKPKNSLLDGNPWNEALYTDSNKITWYKCGNDLYKYNPKNNVFELQNSASFDGSQVLKNSDGSLWINEQSASLFNGKNVYPTFKNPISKWYSGAMLFEDNGRIWKSSGDQRLLEIYDASKWSKGIVLDCEKCKIFRDENLPGNIIFKDRTGLIWIGLNGYGLRKYSFDSDKFKHYAKNHSVTKISAEAQTGLLINTYDGLVTINTEGKQFKNDLPLTGFSQMLNYFVSKSGDLWITKRLDFESPIISKIEKINLVTKEKKIFDVPLKYHYGHSQYITEDKEGCLWIGGEGGSLAFFDSRTGEFKEVNLNKDKSKPFPSGSFWTSIYIDGSGTFWVGSEQGFAKIETENIMESNPKITTFRNDLKEKKSLNNNNVSTFLDDPIDNNLIWIGTKGGGLNLMDKTSGIIRHITTKEGLCDNTVYGILTDEADNIWGSTNNGLFCILSSKDRTGRFEIRHFTEAAGLQAAEYNTNAFTKLPNGNLAFGGINGVNVFNPKEVLVDSFAPNIFVTKLMVGNKIVESNDESGILSKAIEYTNEITLNHEQDIFSLEFSSLDFRTPDQIKYRYKLEGIDEEWIESGYRRMVSYSHLPSGTYTFKVQGSNSLGIWNKNVHQLKIRILPPWWASWWAYTFYLSIIGLGINAYYRYKLSQTKMATQLLFEQNETRRIKELDKIKTHLYTNMTHEFRTPLTVILGMVQQIKRSTQDHLDTGLDMIERNGNNLLRLVNEMLDLSKLEAGKMELNLISGDIVNFIRYIVESFHSIAESQNKKIHYLSSVDYIFTKYDAEKIRQIITNMISNAMKFTTAKGDIYISISLMSEQSNELCIKVKDTGQGIPENEIIYIFDRFYQADSGHTRQAEGTGIGLALTKELVQLMKGTISVKSPPTGSKKGTEFTVILPLEKLDGVDSTIFINEKNTPKENILPVTTNPIQTNNLNYSNNGKELILLVEDNADVVAYTASCLQEYKLAVGRDGQEGFDIACDVIPDLIITDVMMPYMDGFEMTKKLRQDERTSHIPIIMLTAKADLESKLEGIEYGAEAYLEKPFYKDELLLRIKKLLEQRKLLQKAYSKLAGVTVYSKEEVTQEDIIIPSIENQIPLTEDKFVKKVREEIENNLHLEEYTVEKMSKNLFMSYSQLQRKLSALIGQTPNQYLKTLRMEKAKELLKSSDEPIANISSQCGFGDAGYFGKVFKQEFGMTPMEWRNGR